MAGFTFSDLSPTSFLERAGHVFRDRIAIIDGSKQFTYGQFLNRSQRVAGGLVDAGVMPGDRVAALCVNSHVMLELHNAVPWAGGVLVPLNIRQSVSELAYIVKHSGAKILIATAELAESALAVRSVTGVVVVIAGGQEDTYEAMLADGDATAIRCEDERSLVSINYTSGTTGRPKGVMYHHRGAYLQALAMAFHSHLEADSKYLWTLPMFHCDGWCFTWGVTAAGATHVCLRLIEPAEIWRLIRNEGITHFSAAPTVLNLIANAKEASAGKVVGKSIHVDTGGAPPSPTLLAQLAELNMDVTHLYGLTETFGPVGINQWQPQWNAKEASAQARLKARQGVGNVVAEHIRVVDDYGVDVPADGRTMGQLACRGNDLMLGYFHDDVATRAATVDGWFGTGDLGVMHPDGYVEIRDRSKDVIISGGENIASIEVEQVLDSHDAVLESAVVGEPDEKWGEVPVAFVALREGQDVGVAELQALVRSQLASFKVPKRVIFGELPKTSTGKIQKVELRRSIRADQVSTCQNEDN